MQAIAYNLFRYNSIVIAAAIITLLLFYGMQLLIKTGDSIPQRITFIELVDTTMPIIEPELVIDIERPEPIAPPLDQTDTPTTPSINFDGPSIPVVPMELAPPSNPEEAIPFSPGIMVPLIRTNPSYPQRAAARGIEGFVELSFTVNELGDVIDPVVLHAYPEGYFERAALQAIQRWKYSPATDNGTPVSTYDVRQRIVFQMEATSQ